MVIMIAAIPVVSAVITTGGSMKLRKLKKFVQGHHGFGYTQKICSSFGWPQIWNESDIRVHYIKRTSPRGSITSWKNHQWKRTWNGRSYE